jgi:predicted PurR-regulated permease PerM
MLIQKDTFLRQSKKILYTLLPERKYNRTVSILSSLHTKVSQFITVKLLDSFILGILCFIGLLFIGAGHKLPIATMIGIGNIIPYFGSFLATIPCVIIILAESPLKAIIFLIFVLILQWVDNNIISPKLMEDSMDLNAFWVIFALIVMTGLFGFTGIILGVPIFAVIYALIREFINNKYNEKIQRNNQNTNTTEQ